MAKYVLEILDGDRAGDILPVTGAPLRIGRKAVNDLVLADEKTSGVHCEIVLEGDRHVLRDLGSTNGTFIDQKRVTEVVLTTGDVITVGRLRVRFRDENGGAVAGPDFAVHRLDASRLQRRGSPVLLLVLLVLVAGTVGGYLWWQGQGAAATGGGPAARVRAPLVVAGNKLADLGACEAAAGWRLDAAGAGFVGTVQSHSGQGAFEASRGDDAEAADFAVAALAQPITVFSGRSLVIAAFVQTSGAARIGVRGTCRSSDENTVLQFRHGTPLLGAPDWQRIEAELAVPAGFDRLDVELVALLPLAGSSARIDDVAVTEAGAAQAIDHAMTEGGQRLLGTGTAFAVRSTEPTLLGIAPAAVPVEFRGLVAAGLGALSDLGATLEVVPAERSVTVRARGVDGLEFLFPAEAAGQAMARPTADGWFAAVPAIAATDATDFLLGGERTRVQLRGAAPVTWRGRIAGGVFALEVAATEVELVLGFFADWRRARELLGAVRDDVAAARPGAALTGIRALLRTVPQDSAALGQATALRAELLAQLDAAVAELQRELVQARYFDTRGGFERVKAGVEQLIADYGEDNMEGRDLEELRTAAAARLQQLDQAEEAATRARLEQLGKALRGAGLAGLAGLVEDYTRRQLGN
jgi:hypothetical protein